MTATHTQNLQPNVCPSHKKYRDKDVVATEGTAHKLLAQLVVYATGKNQSLTLLKILYYVCREEPSITVL